MLQHARLPLIGLLVVGCPGDDESMATGTQTDGTATTVTSTDAPTNGGTTTTASASATESTTGPTSDSLTGETTSDTGSGSSSGGEPMCPTTRFPGSVDGVEPESYSHHPPVQVAGSLYRMVETPASDGNNPKMMKSDDGGATWAEMDEDGRPDARDLEGTYQLVVEDTIYFSHTAANVWFYAFDASTDTWLALEDVDDTLDDAGSTQYSSLARTGDGQFWIAYSSDLVGGRSQISYRRRMAADDFSAATVVEDTDGEWTGPRLLAGSDDVTHLFYKNQADDELLHRTLSDGGVLSAATRIDTAGTSGIPVPHTHAVTYDSGGSEVIVLAFSGDDDSLKAVTLVDGVAGAEEQVSTDTVLQDAEIVENEGVVAHVVVQGTTVHAMWTDEASGDILYSSRPDGGSWSAEQTVWSSDGQEALYLYCSLVRDGNCPRIGCTYDVGPHADDTGQIEYLEFVL